MVDPAEVGEMKVLRTIHRIESRYRVSAVGVVVVVIVVWLFVLGAVSSKAHASTRGRGGGKTAQNM